MDAGSTEALVSDTPSRKKAPLPVIDAEFFKSVLPKRSVLYPLFAILLAIKFFHVFSSVPLADEGYYWMWGKNLSWSYFDHPPLGGWYLGLWNRVFGDSILASRAATLPIYGISIAVVWYWIKRIAPGEYRRDAFIAAMSIMLGSMWLMLYQNILFHDYLLMGVSVASAHFFVLFIESMSETKWNHKYLYAACALLGLAGLTKYNAVFLGLGFGAWVLFSAQGRQLLKSPHLYFAAGLAIAMQAPVFYWNYIHDWPSFRFNLQDRIGPGDVVSGSSVAKRYLTFLVGIVVMLSPIMFLALLRFAFKQSPNAILREFQKPGRWAFVLSSGVFLALCYTTDVFFYWNVAAIIFFLPIALFFFSSSLEVVLHLVWGLFVSGFMILNSVFVPEPFNPERSPESVYSISFGLDEVVEVIEQEEARLGAEMILTTDYRTAGLIGFEAQRADVMALGARNDMYDFWFVPSEHKGEDALVLTYELYPLNDIVMDNFEKVTKVREIEIFRYDRTVQTYQLYLAENYSGTGAQ